jgi:iron(III) transport system substrate-binding protein
MRKRRIGSVAIGALLAATAVPGYGGLVGADSAPPTTSPENATASFEEEWAALIAAAQEEGEINFVGGPTGASDDGAFYEHFGEVFGLDASLFAGPTEDVTARIFAERDQGLYDYDVASLGNSGTDVLLEAEVLQPLEPMLVHPEATDRSTGWRLDRIPWADEGNELCTYWGVRAIENFQWLFYNSDNVTQEELDSLESWYDLLDPRWKGRIGIGAINEGEQSNMRTQAWLELGQEWFDGILRDQEPQVALYGAARDQADGLARGDYDIVLFPSGGDAAMNEAIDAGLPVAQFDRTLTEGAGKEPIQRLCVFDQPANPNATKLFANWVLTREGQEAYNLYTGREDRASLRDDVPQGNISDELWELAGDERTPVYDTNTDEHRQAEAESLAYLEEVFAELGLTPGG